MDVSGEQGGDISLAKNGMLHKTRLDAQGQRLNVAEWVAPRHWGFTLHKPRAVSLLLCLSLLLPVQTWPDLCLAAGDHSPEPGFRRQGGL